MVYRFVFILYLSFSVPRTIVPVPVSVIFRPENAGSDRILEAVFRRPGTTTGLFRFRPEPGRTGYRIRTPDYCFQDPVTSDVFPPVPAGRHSPEYVSLEDIFHLFSLGVEISSLLDKFY